jgi:hypothetical protein
MIQPYWVDELMRKHEGYPYDDSDAHVLAIKHEGQSLRLLIPKYLPPTDVKVTALAGDLLFLLGEELEEDEDEREALPKKVQIWRNGIVMVARRHERMDNTYSIAVWHRLFPGAAGKLMGKE